MNEDAHLDSYWEDRLGGDFHGELEQGSEEFDLPEGEEDSFEEEKSEYMMADELYDVRGFADDPPDPGDPADW